MERKIYYNLAIVSTLTALITSIVLVFFFYDYYNPKDLSKDININIYQSNSLPEKASDTSYYDLRIDKDKTLRVSRPIQDISHVFLTVLPAMAGILVFILISLYIISSILTGKIIRPIKLASENIESILSRENLDNENIYDKSTPVNSRISEHYSENEQIYDELVPFINTINIQKLEIDHYIKSLEEGEKIRREFTANVSHELKTPLTSINGFAEMIENGMVKDGDIIKSASIIRREGNRLLEMIDSIIKLSKLEDVSLSREFKTINLLDIVKSVYTNLKPTADLKNIKLTISGEETLISGDQRMIEDLIYNLVDNAIKYNKDEGEVNVELLSKDDSKIIRISDTGIGIPLESQRRVFERFYRVDKSRSKKVSGTGLGLSLVKHTVEYHGGSLELSSVEGEGTTIEIRFK